jgi:hypothetical protein
MRDATPFPSVHATTGPGGAPAMPFAMRPVTTSVGALIGALIGTSAGPSVREARADAFAGSERPGRTPRPPHRLATVAARALLVAVAVALACNAARASMFSDQDGGTPAPTPAAEETPTGRTPPADASDGLADAALDADLLDFRMRVPIGTEVRVERGERPSYLLAESGEAPGWRMRIAPLRASRIGSTAASQVDDYLAELRGKGESFEVLVDRAVPISGAEARLYFIAVPLEGGGRGISGGLVVPTGDGRFLVASILVLDAEFDRLRPLLERSLATIELVDRSAERNERAEFLGRSTKRCTARVSIASAPLRSPRMRTASRASTSASVRIPSAACTRAMLKRLTPMRKSSSGTVRRTAASASEYAESATSSRPRALAIAPRAFSTAARWTATGLDSGSRASRDAASSRQRSASSNSR